jgi:hypothetical protein
MKNATDVFSNVEDTAVKMRASKWHLVTNQRNLLYMLAAGLVMSPSNYSAQNPAVLMRQIAAI